jgi:hypothetical protein
MVATRADFIRVAHWSRLFKPMARGVKMISAFSVLGRRYRIADWVLPAVLRQAMRAANVTAW